MRQYVVPPMREYFLAGMSDGCESRSCKYLDGYYLGKETTRLSFFSVSFGSDVEMFVLKPRQSGGHLNAHTEPGRELKLTRLFMHLVITYGPLS